MKSAYELAMERLEARQGKQAELSDDQRKALAEVDEELRAKVAELDIMHQQKAAAARAAGDPSQLEEIARNHRAEIRKLEDRAEADKSRIRKGDGAG